MSAGKNGRPLCPAASAPIMCWVGNTTSPGSSKLRARFRLPGSKRESEAECRVAWSDRRVGMGLQFEKVESVDQAAIDEFVDQHFFSNRKA